LEIILADKAGFCLGVRRAVEMAQRVVAEGPAYSLGDLIHNPQAVEQLRRAGLRSVESLGDIPSGQVVIRSHGVPPSVLESAAERGIKVVDATCPRVRAAQAAARRLRNKGYQVVIAGNPDHPEVVGLKGWAGPGAMVVSSPGEVEQLPRLGRVAVIPQTTQRRQVFEEVVRVLKLKAEEVVVCDTICAATHERQGEARRLARQVDVMLVVGGQKSANTRQLVEVCREAGARTYHVEAPDEIAPSWFLGVKTVGITAGASTPDWILKEVVLKMEEIKDRLGDGKEEVQAAVEIEEKEKAAAEPTAGESPAGHGEPVPGSEERVEQGQAAGETETAEAVGATGADETTETTEAPEAVEAAGTAEPAGAVAAGVGTDEEKEEQVEETDGSEVPDEKSVAAEEAQAQAEGEEGEEAPEAGLAMEDVDLEVAFEPIHAGDIVRGKVVHVGKDHVLVDVGHKSEGMIPLSELSHELIDDPNQIVKLGEEIDVYVLSVEGKEGGLLLSKKRADEERAWKRLQDAQENDEVIEAPVLAEVKGGLVVDVGLRGFVPASHVERGYVSDLSQYVGKTVRAKVLELDRSKNRVILSQKVVLEEEYQRLREQTWATIKEGDVRQGVVKGITDFGAFVDLGGVDGLLHVSEMSWGRVGHPSEVVEEGQEIEVMVLRVDRERGRISLGLKQLLPDPWDGVDEKYPVDSLVEGKVVRLAPFGAFVELEPGVEGLIHISELANRRVGTPDEVVSPGDVIKVKVLKVRSKDKRISLSLKEAEQETEKQMIQEYMDSGERSGVSLREVVGDILEETKEKINEES